MAVDNNGIADLYDGDIENADASLSGTIAGWAVAMTTDQDASKSSYSVSGAVAGVTLTATGSNDDLYMLLAQVAHLSSLHPMQWAT